MIIWLGILFCLTQSAMFSGLNLAFFSVSKFRLEIESSQGNKHDVNILHMREDAKFLLTTILWGNVSINVLLTLLSNSVMAGMFAFFFSRNALRLGYYLAPLLRIYQFLLYPVKSQAR